MGSIIDLSAITSNPLEVDNIGSFVVERGFDEPVLNAIHTVWTGVKMKEQIVLASQMGLTGIKDTGCDRPESGATTTLSELFWEPVSVGDTLPHCQKEVDPLFKAYYTKIQKYIDLYDIEGSDLEKFLSVMLSESLAKSIMRIVWLSDTAVAASGVGTAGLKSALNVKFYDQLDGLWKQIFTKVGTSDIVRYNIAENALGTIAAQKTLADGRAVEIFEDMWENADSRLRADDTKQFLVSREIFENYRKYLQGKGENFTIEYTTEGLQQLKWNGVPVINMENVWDLRLRADFEDGSDTNLLDLPNRVVFTIPANIPVATLNESDLSEIDIWYEKKERKLYSAYGYTLDAKVIEGYLINVAY